MNLRIILIELANIIYRDIQAVQCAVDERKGIRMNIACNNGDFELYSKQDIEKLLRKSSLNPYDDIWISGEKDYPCLAILINGAYACVHYFLNEDGDMWQSIGDCEQDILFSTNGEEPAAMPGDCVISLEKAIQCAVSFFYTVQRPACIAWREL